MEIIDLLHDILRSDEDAKAIEKMLINSAISGRMINNERSIICENEIEESIKKENESKSKGYRGKSIIPLSKEEIPFFIAFKLVLGTIR